MNKFILFILFMYFLIVLLPLIGGCFVGLGGRWIGRLGSAYLSTFILFLTWLLAVFSFYEVCMYSNIVSVSLYTWLLIDIYQINIGLLYDSVSSSW